MAQNAEAQAFLRRLGDLPDTAGIDLGPAISPSLQDEAELRRLFATDRTNERLKDPCVGLVDVFGQNTDRIKKIHARAIKDDDDLRKHHVMPLENAARRKDGELSMASSLEDFKSRWAIFTEGVLSQLPNWNNIVAAGGSVLACLAHLPEQAVKQGSKRALRKYYHSEAYPASDVDLFLYGLTPEQAEEKCLEIYNAVRDSVPWEVCAVRTKNAVSIHSQFPYRPIQIVLRIYQSPAEILAGFDVDSACVAFDGTRVLATPRAIMALMTQCNQVAMDRRSPSYEVRLAKYAARGFEIHVPDLRREDFDPTIFERAVTRVAGLARLLVFEKFDSQYARDGYLNQRRRMRGRPNAHHKQRDMGLDGDLKHAADFTELQMSEYDVMFHIPYGPGITAKKICKFVYQTDLGMNSTFNPNNKDRRLHRHPAFFGNMKEALEDCCEYCPLPQTDGEKEMFAKEQEQFLTGRVKFIQEDPGRQSITGSFHPIDSGEWSEHAYVKPITKLFSHIASHNRAACNDFLKYNADAINGHDHLGRTPLQFALLCSAEDISLDLIEQGARMRSRMIDGRCSLHLAAQMGMVKVVKSLLEKSEKNKIEKGPEENDAKEEDVKDKDVDMENQKNETRDSSEDDWSSEDKGASSDDDDEDGDKDDEDDKEDEDEEEDEDDDEEEEDDGDDDDDDEDYEEAKRTIDPRDKEDAFEESEDVPDILDVDALDWDQSLTALGYAIIGGSLPIVQILVAAGADCKTPRKLSTRRGSFYPLSLTALTPDESVGAQIAEHLITAGGASCSVADSKHVTVFHRLVDLNKVQIVETILKVDSTAKVASQILWTGDWRYALHPMASAFADGQRAMAAVLLAYAGSRTFIDLETYDRSITANPKQGKYTIQTGEEYWKLCTRQPVEASLSDHNDLYRLVLALEPEYAKNSVPRDVYSYQEDDKPGLRRSMLDLLRSGAREIKRRSRGLQIAQTTQSDDNTSTWRSIFDLSDMEISEKQGWDAYAIALERRNREITEASSKAVADANDKKKAEEEQRAQAAASIPYLQQALKGFEMAGARTWDEIHKDMPSEWKTQYGERDFDPDDPDAPLNTSSVRAQPHSSTMEATVDDKTKPFKRYSLFVADGGEADPGTHLIPLYDELYEACWNGDNDKIRALCLPPKDETARPQSDTWDLLQITAIVRYKDHTKSWIRGYTPLFVALRGRKWDTARLILEVAQEQLMKDEEGEDVKTVNRGETVIQLADAVGDDKDDNDSDVDSCASDDTEKRPAMYSDLSKRFHAISVNVKPNQLLTYNYSISLTIQENDLEAFTQIADMMENLEEPIPLTESVRDSIFMIDSPELLDAYLRRTGDGLLLPKPNAKGPTPYKAQTQHHDGDDNEYKIYLGLNVDGKKRKDLARREDPNAPYEPDTETKVPIVWRAAAKQAPAALEYLSSPKAIEAYKYYAETKNTKLAKRLVEALRETYDFPRMVGFSVSRLAETPVLATFHYPTSPDRILPTLKKLMQLHPHLTADGVRLQVKPNRMSALLLLCCTTAPPEAFDWMLANGADPLVRDERGWNILHLMFETSVHSTNMNWSLIEHVIVKLPADVTGTLMAQQSYTQRNTPFAIAVKKGNLRIVELLLRAVKNAVVPTLLLRDSTGATPLHSAILKGWPRIVSHLVDVGPPEMLYLENGVGSTPMEIARLQFLGTMLNRLGDGLNQARTLHVYDVDTWILTSTPGMRDRDEEEIRSLRRVIDGIKSSGILATKPELLEVLSNFADNSEQEFAAWAAQKPKEESRPPSPLSRYGSDDWDPETTFHVFSKAVVEVHQRQLVHLRDVQHAVLTAADSQPKRRPPAWVARAEGFDEEEPERTENLEWSELIGYPKCDSEVTS